MTVVFCGWQAGSSRCNPFDHAVAMTILRNQVAVVTGAGSGIGKAIALALARHGALLALAGRRLGPLESVADAARTLGVKAHAYACDLALDNEIRNLAAAIGRDFGRVDVVVHNAAILRMGSAAEASVEDFDLQYQTNLRSPYLLTQLLLPLLLSSKGQVAFINSSAGLLPRANVGQYAATKHALKALADSLRDEVNGFGVRVLTVYPGRTATPNQERLHALEGRQYRPDCLLQPEDVAAVVMGSLTLPRTAEVTDIRIRPMVKPDSAESSP
jgi:NAD(P)-dependent dehydrogenase (short-subunit alcohol dehydrogenase family)